MKNIIIAILLVCGLCGIVAAAPTDLNYTHDGFGTFTKSIVDEEGYQHDAINYLNDYGGTLYFKWDGYVVDISETSLCFYAFRDSYNYYHGKDLGTCGGVGAHVSSGITTSNGELHKVYAYHWLSNDAISANYILTVSNYSITDHTISGTAGCTEWIDLYVKNVDDAYVKVERNESEEYSFTVRNNTDYKLVFSDAGSYEFTVEGENVEYDYDACSHIIFNLKEHCGNLIPDSQGRYCMDYTAGGGVCRYYDAPTGVVDLSNESLSGIQVFTSTFMGDSSWTVSPVETDHTYDLFDRDISWRLKVIVMNESDETLIDGAIVKVDQTCYCTEGFSTRQKLTSSGMASFSDMSLQDASLLVMKTGYKLISENSTGYDAFLSARSNFSSKTWVVKLAPSWSANVSSWYEIAMTTDIHFRNVDGNRTSKILDTDAYVRLYYSNNNSDNSAMTLKFQSSSTHSFFTDEDSWNIPHGESGYKTITTAYFNPWDYSYRGTMYNSSIHGWNITIPLTVRNDTKETEQHYENLTTDLWFMYVTDALVDYREDMKIGIHACSNNTTLLTVDIELWDNNEYASHTNLSATSFTDDYYMWEPSCDYVSGHNYSIRMYGFDRTLLETDYVECITDATVRKNRLTIGVKDKYGNNINNAYIYLEDWGSLSTGSVYYNAYEGLENGEYRYKASKSGYTSSGWLDVNISDEDMIVWYTIIEDTAAGSVATEKFTDDDIKEFFFPLMYFLLICIILGGLKYVSS